MILKALQKIKSKVGNGHRDRCIGDHPFIELIFPQFARPVYICIVGIDFIWDLMCSRLA